MNFSEFLIEFPSHKFKFFITNVLKVKYKASFILMDSILYSFAYNNYKLSTLLYKKPC